MTTKRRHLDQYNTLQEMVLPLFEEIEIYGDVLEPCAGDGAISWCLQHNFTINSVTTNDIDPQFNCDFTSDMLDHASPIWERGYHWLITNPPWDQAKELLEHAWGRVDNIAFLLRLSFLEPTTNKKGNDGNGRKVLLSNLERNFEKLIVFGSPRPSYTLDGKTDSVTSAWMVWRKHPVHDNPIIFVHDWITGEDVTQRKIFLATVPF